MTWKEQFLEIICFSGEFLWQFNSKSSLLFNKYLPELQKMSSWKIVFSHDGYHKVRISAWKWHEKSNFWRLIACLVYSFDNSTQNQAYFSTNTFPISRKCHLEKMSFHMMDIISTEFPFKWNKNLGDYMEAASFLIMNKEWSPKLEA